VQGGKLVFLAATGAPTTGCTRVGGERTAETRGAPRPQGCGPPADAARASYPALGHFDSILE